MIEEESQVVPNVNRPALLPDLACVGFPKCATTFILKLFRQFEFETLSKREFNFREIQNYQREINEAQLKNQPVAIKSPRLIYERNNMELLISANTKIIIGVRNPARWLKSYYSHRLRSWAKGRRPPNHQENDLIPSFREIALEKKAWWGVSIERGRMANIIQRNMLSSNMFDAKNVLFIIQEEFEMNFEKVYSEILAFINPPDTVNIRKTFKFEYTKPTRYMHFKEDAYQKELEEIFSSDMLELSRIVEEYTSKNLLAIWKQYDQRNDQMI